MAVLSTAISFDGSGRGAIDPENAAILLDNAPLARNLYALAGILSPARLPLTTLLIAKRFLKRARALPGFVPANRCETRIVNRRDDWMRHTSLLGVSEARRD